MNKPELPLKTREAFSHHFNSKKWDNFPFRDNDIVVTTSYKSGTHWMQNIIICLLNQGKSIPPHEETPWLDLRFPSIDVQLPLLEKIEGRRQLKTHLRLDALNFSPKAKYIYIGRDGRDQFMSLYNHYKSGSDKWYGALNGFPGLVGPPIPVFSSLNYTESSFFDDWISKGFESMEDETDGYPFWSCFDHARTWWEYRHLPNIKFIHFADMLADLKGSIRDVAEFLEIPIQEEYLDDIVKANTFDEMKKNANENPLFQKFNVLLTSGAQGFLNKGQNGRWRGVLSEEQLAKYDSVVKSKLTPECEAWFEGGKASGVDPKSI